MPRDSERGWSGNLGYRNSNGTERRSPVGFYQSPDVVERSNRNLAGPLRRGTAPGVGPRYGMGDPSGSDFGMDRITPRGFDPMGTSLTREPRQEGSELVSREVRRFRRDER